jgi:hypothetical protein
MLPLYRRFRKIGKANISFDMSVRLSICPHRQLGSHWTDFHEFDIGVFFENLTRITGTIHEDLRTLIISRQIHLRMRNVPDESCRENQNTQFTLNNFFSKFVPFMRYVEKYGRVRQATDDNIIRRMSFACWITKATDTHSEYVTFIAFQRQQWLRERASILRYTLPVFFIFLIHYPTF